MASTGQGGCTILASGILCSLSLNFEDGEIRKTRFEQPVLFMKG